MNDQNVMPNVRTTFNEHISYPEIDPSAYVHPLAAVIGAVYLGKRVMVSPCASIRADEGSPIFVGDYANVQDGCVIHALETCDNGSKVEQNLMQVDGKEYAVYVGKNVCLAHQVLVHGPAVVRDNTFLGFQAIVFKSEIGEGCVLEFGAKVIGVKVPAGRYVPINSVVNSQEQADALPVIDDNYPLGKLGSAVVHVNVQFADGYAGRIPAELQGGGH
ncbi:carbonic anhydrase [Thermodesulfobacteriota bacterium]